MVAGMIGLAIGLTLGGAVGFIIGLVDWLDLSKYGHGD
jgi:ABC-type nitrate/sulfonate/bicarbonate transport system permease component